MNTLDGTHVTHSKRLDRVDGIQQIWVCAYTLERFARKYGGANVRRGTCWQGRIPEAIAIALRPESQP